MSNENKSNLTWFVDYCFNFYGKNGLHKMDYTKTEITKAAKFLIKNQNFLGRFLADSFDREKVYSYMEFNRQFKNKKNHQSQ